jgi:hypothetical protein
LSQNNSLLQKWVFFDILHASLVYVTQAHVLVFAQKFSNQILELVTDSVWQILWENHLVSLDQTGSNLGVGVEKRAEIA